MYDAVSIENDTPTADPIADQTDAFLHDIGVAPAAKKEPAAPVEIPDISFNLNSNSITMRLTSLVNAYDKQVIKDATQLRTYVTHKLIEMSHCGDGRQELKALELLGKISEVGLFSERSEVTITHTTSSELEAAIKERITRLLAVEPEKEVEEVEEVEDAEVLELEDFQEEEETEEEVLAV
jgi:hypothetical protein